ncbi:permease prefix domain 1-containing protein [Luedemannella flava]
MRVTDGHLIIDEYVAGLGRRLVGPARLKAELLAEARDGLVDAAETAAGRGLDAPAAQRHAVAEFGTYTQVAPAYQVELAAAQGGPRC